MIARFVAVIALCQACGRSDLVSEAARASADDRDRSAAAASHEPDLAPPVQAPSAGSAAPAPAGRGTVAAAGSGAAGQDSAEGSAGRAAPVQPSEVWIGEMWSLGSALCDRDDPDARFHLPLESTTERVVLVLDTGPDPAAPRGRMRFGEGEPPSEPAESWPITEYDDEEFFFCTSFMPTAGVEYTLFDVRRTADRLSFLLVPAEVWQPWCARQGFMNRVCPLADNTCDNPCPCDANGCDPGNAGVSAYDFAVEDDLMQGTTGPSLAIPIELRLLRVR